jgi:hypothetical protein
MLSEKALIFGLFFLKKGGSAVVGVRLFQDHSLESHIADCGKRVLLSHLFDFVFREFRVQRFKHSTNMSPKSKSKRGERRTRLQ